MWQTLQQFFPHLVTTRAINKTFTSVFYPTVIPVTPITHSWTFWKLLPYILRAATKKKERKTKKAITIQSHFMERAAPFPCLYKQQWNQHAQKPLTVSSGMAIVTCTGRSNFTKYTTVSLFPALVLDWGEAGGGGKSSSWRLPCSPINLQPGTRNANIWLFCFTRIFFFFFFFFPSHHNLQVTAWDTGQQNLKIQVGPIIWGGKKKLYLYLVQREIKWGSGTRVLHSQL